ncbi:MAG: hypothetical protein GXX82_11850 [Syntrophorhabdus sp.]|nr:hypothetical protein [Syntrophorhabdus sp.]
MYLHPSAILLNSFSMTALMLVCGLAGASGLAADIAVVQGATLALFFAFSANARNVIFGDASHSAPHLLLRARLFLLFPLAAASFVLSCVIGSAEAGLAVVLIVRRSLEWIGEVYLSSYEMQDARRPAAVSIIWECLTFVGAILLMFAAGIGPDGALALWALAPLVTIFAGRLARSDEPVRLMDDLARLAPNLGSTTIIGITVYVFRLSTILVAGRVVAGDLFTAFALGGIIPTIYNNSIGPSLALREQRGGGTPKLSTRLALLAAALFVVGAAFTVFSVVFTRAGGMLGKDGPFWTAVGLSVSGGAIMILALNIRIRMIQAGRSLDVFGADAISNVLLVVCVPYFYYVLGPSSMEALYLFSAVLTVCFYWSAKRGTEAGTAYAGGTSWLLLFMAALVLFPLFFQLGSGIFRDSSLTFDTGRVLEKLPIPVSVLALSGILLLGRFSDARRSLTFFFFAALLLVIAALMVREQGSHLTRLVLMGQYVLPMLGLVLGEMFGKESREREFEKACLAVAIFIAPAQLLCSWAQGLVTLSPYLYAFSIYQHLQYVPLIMVIAYGVALGSLWKRGRKWRIAMVLLLPWMVIYSLASVSMVTVMGLTLSVIATLFVFKSSPVPRRIALGMLVLSLAAGTSYGLVAGMPVYEKMMSSRKTSAKTLSVGIDHSEKGNRISVTATPPQNIIDRMEQWRYYGKGVLSGAKRFLFGHATPPDRRLHPSAQNYYLDLVYNFGFLPFTPILLLLIYTARRVYHLRRPISLDPSIPALAVSAFVLFAVDNMLKVGLRQPYPGIFSFFVLGFLLARLDRSGFPGRLAV